MENEEVGQQQGVEEKNLVPTVSLTARDQEKAITSSSPSPSSPSSSSSSVCPDPLTMATIAVSELCDVAKAVNHIELAAICHSVNLLVDDTEADISRLVHSSSSGSDISSKNHQLRFYSSVSDKKSNKSEEQQAEKSLSSSSSSSSSKENNNRKSVWGFSSMFGSVDSQDYEDITNEMIIKAPITDICIVAKGDSIPPGYYRVAKTPGNHKANFNNGTGGKSMYLCIKKDVHGKEIPIVNLTVIFPDKNETVPPGFFVVRRGSQGCNLNQGTSGERICICYKKEVNGNYLTDIQLIFPGKNENVPQSFNLIESSSSNLVADLNAGTTGVRALLAYRQAMPRLECLVADESVINSYMYKYNQRRDRASSVGSNTSSNREGCGSANSNKSGGSTSKSPSAYQKANTDDTPSPSPSPVLGVSFNSVGQDASAASFTTITGGGDENEISGGVAAITVSSYSSPSHENVDQFQGDVGIGIGTPTSTDGALSSSHHHIKTSESMSSASDHHLSPSQQDEQEIVDALESGYDEHEDGVSVGSNDDAYLEGVFYNRVITRDGVIAPKEIRKVISPLIFALYVRHGRVAEISMKCLNELLKDSDFFNADLKVLAGSGCVTFLDVVIEAICDRLESLPENQWQQSFEFIEILIKKYKAAVSALSLKRILNALSFICSLGSSDQLWLDQNFSMPGPNAYTDYDAHKLIKQLVVALSKIVEDIAPVNCLPDISFDKKWMDISIDSLDESDDEKEKANASSIDSSMQQEEYSSIQGSSSSSSSRSSIGIGSSSEQIVKEILCEFIDDRIDSVEIAKYSEQILLSIARSNTQTMTNKYWHRISVISKKIFANVECRNTFLLLCTLCRGAHMNIREMGSSGYARDLGYKLIALDAIAEFCMNASEALTTSKVYGYLVRRLVVPCVLFNITYAFRDARIFSKVLRIITALWNKWRTHIKIEFAILCEQLFIRVLQASSMKVKPEFKKIALEEVRNWFDRSHILLEMFLNFDMDSKFVSHWNVLSHLTRAICTLAKRSVIVLEGREYSEKVQQVSFLALGVVAYIAKTMMDASGHAHLIQDDPEFKAKALKEGRGWEVDESEEDRGTALRDGEGGLDSSTGCGDRKSTQGARYRKQVNREANEILEEAISLYKAKNNSLKKAINFLVKKNFMADTAQEIANFLRLYKNSFDPSAIGDYLGEGGTSSEEIEYWEQVRFKFVRGVSFAQMPVEQALRVFLTGCGFRLPGESQKIDRFIDSFVKVYWQDNDKTEYCPFRHADTVHLLSFALIMLNTDLHRATDDGAKKKRKKMTKDEFVRNLRGADQGENIDRDILSSMYDNILASPIEMEVQSSELSITEDSSKEKADTEISTNGVADESKFASDVSKGLRDAEDVLRSLSIFTHRFQMTAVDVNISMDLVRFMFDAVWMNIHAVAELCLASVDHNENVLNTALDIIISGITAAIFLDSQMERLAFATILKNFRNLLPALCQQVEDTSDWFDTVQNAFSGNAGQVISVLHTFVMSIREDIRAKIEIDYMLKIMSRIVPKSSQLATENISFLREGDLNKISSKGRLDLYHFFLFSDTLLYCSTNMLNDAYKIHEQLPLIAMVVSDHTEDTSGCSLYIKHPTKSFVVLCEDQNTKREWLRDLTRAIEDKKRRFQAHEKVVEEVRQILLQFDPLNADTAQALVKKHKGQERCLIRSLKSDYAGEERGALDDSMRVSYCTPTQQEKLQQDADATSLFNELNAGFEIDKGIGDGVGVGIGVGEPSRPLSTSIGLRTVSHPSAPVNKEESMRNTPSSANDDDDDDDDDDDNDDNDNDSGLIDAHIDSFVATLNNEQLDKCFNAGLISWKTLLDDKSKSPATNKMIYRLYGLYKQAKEGNIADHKNNISPQTPLSTSFALEDEATNNNSKDNKMGDNNDNDNSKIIILVIVMIWIVVIMGSPLNLN